MTTLKDSGERQEFETGAVRDTATGKGRFDLLPFHAIKLLAKHFEAGAFKYGDNNWRKGIPLKRYLDSALRHLTEFAEGERDEPHLVSALWNIACLLETRHMIGETGLDQHPAMLKAQVDDIDYFDDDPYPEIFKNLQERAEKKAQEATTKKLKEGIEKRLSEVFEWSPLASIYDKMLGDSPPCFTSTNNGPPSFGMLDLSDVLNRFAALQTPRMLMYPPQKRMRKILQQQWVFEGEPSVEGLPIADDVSDSEVYRLWEKFCNDK